MGSSPLCIVLFEELFTVNLHDTNKRPKNKKVLLRERKRHTARRVVSTPSVVLPGYPTPSWPGRGGVPDQGTPLGRVPPDRVTPLARVPPRPGYPPARVPLPPARVPLLAGPDRVPPPAGPGRVPPLLPHGILGNVAKHYGIWVPPQPPHGILGNVAKHYGIWIPPRVWTN